MAGRRESRTFILFSGGDWSKGETSRSRSEAMQIVSSPGQLVVRLEIAQSMSCTSLSESLCRVSNVLRTIKTRNEAAANIFRECEIGSWNSPSRRRC